MRSCEYPIGNPVVVTREAIKDTLPWTSSSQNKYKGLFHVCVLPPRNLRRPLLPYRTKGRAPRLIFPLCKKCATDAKQDLCKHSDSERAWIDGYTHSELNKALDIGYVVTDIFEVIFGLFYSRNNIFRKFSL